MARIFYLLGIVLVKIVIKLTRKIPRKLFNHSAMFFGKGIGQRPVLCIEKFTTKIKREIRKSSHLIAIKRCKK